MGLRKVNTIGLKQANKYMQLSAIAYNLKKYLKFTQKRVKSGAEMLGLFFRLKTTLKEDFKALLTYVNFPSISIENRLKAAKMNRYCSKLWTCETVTGVVVSFFNI